METEDSIEVPGATLFYKVRGTGPVVLIVQGGAADRIGVGLPEALTCTGFDRFQQAFDRPLGRRRAGETRARYLNRVNSISLDRIDSGVCC
jgi:hypothetical protein